MDRRMTFQRIWETNAWGSAETRSGPGSQMVATETVRRLLPELIRGTCSHRVLDVGCGEANWIPTGEWIYTGIDVVPGAIDVARIRHLGPGRRFLVADARYDLLPTADLILCRDVMCHMNIDDGLAMLWNIKHTGATWLIATTFEGGQNQNVETGDFYYINLEAWPFAMGKPWMVIEDTWRHPDKYLGVWSL